MDVFSGTFGVLVLELGFIKDVWNINFYRQVLQYLRLYLESQASIISIS
jgi:hypothetical protein